MSPYLTHPFVALLRWAVVFAILFALKVPGAEWFAFAYAAAYFEGREADDVEHRAKHQVPAIGGFASWTRAAFWYGWSLANLGQAAAAIAPVFAATVTVAYLGRV